MAICIIPCSVISCDYHVRIVDTFRFSFKLLASLFNPSLQENKEYKDFKDKDVSEIYIRYRQLFGDSSNGEKYAVTPTKLCKTGFGLFEENALEDHRDAFSVDGESSE